MPPVEVLMNEHRLIESVMDALEVYVGRLSSSEPVDREDLGRFADFIRRFADHCHHGKEEDILFASMVEHGMPQEAGPIAVMLSEHVQGRRLVGVLVEAAKNHAAWTEQDLQRIREAAFAYTALLRQHIQKEDGILYPMAQSLIPEDAMEEIGQRFDRFEEEETGAGEHEKLHAVADELVARYTGKKAACNHHSAA